MVRVTSDGDILLGVSIVVMPDVISSITDSVSRDDCNVYAWNDSIEPNVKGLIICKVIERVFTISDVDNDENVTLVGVIVHGEGEHDCTRE